MATDFINAFRRMQIHEREQALQALTTELSPYEWRALHATTNSRTFQFDVVGRLPLELVAQVFCHLDPAAPYRLQSVSRRWNDILRGLHILKTSLSQWYQGTVKLEDADYALCEMKARKIHAFRTGKPSQVYKISPNDGIYSFNLVGNSLIWQHVLDDGRPSRFACVLDLDEWHLRTLGGQARETIMNVSVSSELVVLATWAGICYVHELQGKRSCKKFRVPNIDYFANFACRERTVACVDYDERCTSVYIWEYDSQRGRSFEIRHDKETIFSESDPARTSLHVLAPLVQPKTQTIIIFANASRATTRPHEQRHLAFSRYTYSGECISTHHPSLPGISDIMSWSFINNFVPVDYKQSLLAIHVQEQSGANTSSLLLLFNEEDNDLSVWRGSYLHGKERFHHDGGPMALWRDTCYGALWEEEAEQRDMIAHMGTSDARRYLPIVSESKDEQMAAIRKDLYSPIVMNERYVVRNAVDRFYLLCFDDDDKGKWPKKRGSFFDMGDIELLKTTQT